MNVFKKNLSVCEHVHSYWPFAKKIFFMQRYMYMYCTWECKFLIFFKICWIFFNRSLMTVIYTHAYKIYETGRTIWSLTLMSWGEQGTWSECPDWRRTSARRNRACSRRVPRGDRESKQSSDWIRFELLIVVVKLF